MSSVRTQPNLFGRPMQRIRSDTPEHPPAFKRSVGSLVVWVRSPFSIDDSDRWSFSIVPERDAFGYLASIDNAFSSPTEAAQGVERFLGALSEIVIAAQVSAALAHPHAAPRRRKPSKKKAKTKKRARR